jgi:carboxypeptidase family protein
MAGLVILSVLGLLGRRSKGGPQVAAVASAAPESSRRSAPTPMSSQMEVREAAWTLTGQVVTSLHRGISGATVCVGGGEARAGAVPHCVSTDEGGRFSIAISRSVESPSDLLASARGYRTAKRDLTGPRTNGEPVVLVLRRAGGPTLEGRVVDAIGGYVAGATVTARQGTQAWLPTDITESDGRGRFELAVAPGSWVLTASAEAYSVAELQVVAPTSGVTLSLMPASSISGRTVLEGSDAPVADLVIQAKSDERLAEPPFVTTTDAEGGFRFDRLAAGGYALAVATQQYRSEPLLVALGVGEAKVDLEIAVLAATSLTGRVSSAQGPCPEGHVELVGPLSLVGNIDATGNVRVDGIAPGSYQVTVHCVRGAPLVERLAIGVQPVEREWRIDEGLALTGRVQRANGQPYLGARVSVRTKVPSGALDNISPADGTPVLDSQCVSDGAGNFTCGGLLPGDYVCRLVDAFDEPRSAVSVTLGAEAEAAIVLVAPASGTIRAVLSNATPTSLIPGRAFARNEKSGETAFGAQREQGFEFEGLPLGTYAVSTGVPTAENNTYASIEQDGQVVEVALPAPELMDIRGRVVDARGEPVVDAVVGSQSLSGASTTPGEVLSDASGAFTVTNIPAGHYTVRANSPEGEGSATDVESGARDVVIAVAPSGSLSGTVRTESGESVPQFEVSYLKEGDTGGATLATRGQFAITSLRPGSYEVQVTSPSGSKSLKGIRVASGANVELEIVLERPVREQTL